MMYEFVKAGDALLDVGIGTGLGSVLFHKAGLEVSGFDHSRDMLEICGSKGFAANLVKHDLRTAPFPYQDASFDHVISLGVLNFYSDLSQVFSEVSRLLRPGGVFGFTVEEQKPGQQAEYTIRTGDESGDEASKVRMYRHADRSVKELLAQGGISVLKETEFLADRYPDQAIDICFKAYVCRKG